MNARICQNCGQRFLSETIRDYIEFFAMLGLTLYAPILEVGLIRQGRWVCVILNLIGLVGLIYEMISRHKLKAGEVVKLGKRCPSCGGETVQMNSPLGQQLMAIWPSSRVIDSERVDAEQSIIQGADDEVLEASIGDPCENGANHS
jgi:ribosomal protein S27AE